MSDIVVEWCCRLRSTAEKVEVLEHVQEPMRRARAARTSADRRLDAPPDLSGAPLPSGWPSDDSFGEDPESPAASCEEHVDLQYDEPPHPLCVLRSCVKFFNPT